MYNYFQSKGGIMKKNLNLSILLIVAMILYALCGLSINQHGGYLYLSWLFWNLFLAVLPVFFAFGVQMIPKWNIVSIFLSILWILFLPNACYMVTEFIFLYWSWWKLSSASLCMDWTFLHCFRSISSDGVRLVFNTSNDAKTAVQDFYLPYDMADDH